MIKDVPSSYPVATPNMQKSLLPKQNQPSKGTACQDQTNPTEVFDLMDHPVYTIDNIQFRLAFFIGDGGICPGEIQGPDHVLVAVLRRDVQNRLSLGLIPIERQLYIYAYYHHYLFNLITR